MAHVTLPNPLTDGVITAKGSEVRANDDAIVGQVNGNLDDSNIKVGAGIDGNKLSNVGGARVPTDRIEDDAIDATKLRDDAVNDGLRAVNTNHIRDSAVKKEKIAVAAVVLTKLGTTVQTIAWTGVMGALPANLQVTLYKFVNGANYNITLHVTGRQGGAGLDAGHFEQNLVPGTPIPTATAEILAMYCDNVVLGNPNTSGRVVVISIART